MTETEHQDSRSSTSVDSDGLTRRGLLTGAASASLAGIIAASAATMPVASAATASGSFANVRASRPDNLHEIVLWDGAELSVAVRRRLVSCVEVMTAYLDHIDQVNPSVNAIVNLRPRSELLAEAAEKDRLLQSGDYQGWMHGFPHAVKDLASVAGMKTTFGFFRPPFDLGPATTDSLIVERIRAAGAIFIGKTNTPEFGLGSQTYNNVFGTTFNAYDQTKTAGGSSGGAAVAVALRMLPVADGSDFMGSLRNPPGWNNVFGLRPEAFLAQGGVEGPIARTALDLALLLRTISGYDARAPLPNEQDARSFTRLRGKLRGQKVAWLANLGGYLPMEPEVLEVTQRAVDAFSDLGMQVSQVDDLPAFGSFRGNQDLWPTWLIFRHWLIGGTLRPLYDIPLFRAAMKPEAIYEVQGLISGADGNPAISALDTYLGAVKRTDLYQGFRQLFETYDYVVLPTAQVFPFDADVTWPRSIEGVQMSSYHRWMEVTAIGTLLNAPTLAMPAGFSSAGLPIGLQVIGKSHDDFSLLGLAHAWEKTTRWVERVKPALLHD